MIFRQLFEPVSLARDVVSSPGHRARVRLGQALRVAAKRRPSLTAARHGSAIEQSNCGREGEMACRGRTEKCFMIELNESCNVEGRYGLC